MKNEYTGTAHGKEPAVVKSLIDPRHYQNLIPWRDKPILGCVTLCG